MFSSSFIVRPVRTVLSLTLIVALVFSPEMSYAQSLMLPQPGSMVGTSSAFVPALLKGVRVHPDDPMMFDFIVDSGDTGLALDSAAFKQESETLIKYFLASLTVAEKDMWVNLSPYEADRITSAALEQTAMGRDLLAQDYILKQLTATMLDPDSKLGKEFWTRVYAKAQAEFGSTEIPVDTFNKVWVTADKADVLEQNNTAFVVGSHLKVMLEADYLAASRHSERSEESPAQVAHQLNNAGGPSTRSSQSSSLAQDDVSSFSTSLSKQILREIVIPEIEKEVNEGENFAMLRQMFHALILASWFKKALKESLLGQVYADQGKVGGIRHSERSEESPVRNGREQNNAGGPSTRLASGRLAQDDGSSFSSVFTPEEIYQQYLAAYKKGVVNLIKEEVDPATQELTPRKYFSGGVDSGMAAHPRSVLPRDVAPGALRSRGDLAQIATTFDSAMSSGEGFGDIAGNEIRKRVIQEVIQGDFGAVFHNSEVVYVDGAFRITVWYNAGTLRTRVYDLQSALFRELSPVKDMKMGVKVLEIGATRAILVAYVKTAENAEDFVDFPTDDTDAAMDAERQVPLLGGEVYRLIEIQQSLAGLKKMLDAWSPETAAGDDAIRFPLPGDLRFSENNRVIMGKIVSSFERFFTHLSGDSLFLGYAFTGVEGKRELVINSEDKLDDATWGVVARWFVLFLKEWIDVLEQSFAGAKDTGGLPSVDVLKEKISAYVLQAELLSDSVRPINTLYLDSTGFPDRDARPGDYMVFLLKVLEWLDFLAAPRSFGINDEEDSAREAFLFQLVERAWPYHGVRIYAVRALLEILFVLCAEELENMEGRWVDFVMPVRALLEETDGGDEAWARTPQLREDIRELIREYKEGSGRSPDVVSGEILDQFEVLGQVDFHSRGPAAVDEFERFFIEVGKDDELYLSVRVAALAQLYFSMIREDADYWRSQDYDDAAMAGRRPVVKLLKEAEIVDLGDLVKEEPWQGTDEFGNHFVLREYQRNVCTAALLTEKGERVLEILLTDLGMPMAKFILGHPMFTETWQVFRRLGHEALHPDGRKKFGHSARLALAGVMMNFPLITLRVYPGSVIPPKERAQVLGHPNMVDRTFAEGAELRGYSWNTLWTIAFQDERGFDQEVVLGFGDVGEARENGEFFLALREEGGAMSIRQIADTYGAYVMGRSMDESSSSRDRAMGTGLPTEKEITSAVRGVMRISTDLEPDQYTQTIEEEDGSLVVSIVITESSFSLREDVRRKIVERFPTILEAWRMLSVEHIETPDAPQTIKFRISTMGDEEWGELFVRALRVSTPKAGPEAEAPGAGLPVNPRLLEIAKGVLLANGVKEGQCKTEVMNSPGNDEDREKWTVVMDPVEAWSSLGYSKESVEGDLKSALAEEFPGVEIVSTPTAGSSETIKVQLFPARGSFSVSSAARRSLTDLILRASASGLLHEEGPSSDGAAMRDVLPSGENVARFVNLFLPGYTKDDKYELSVLEGEDKIVVSIEMDSSEPWGTGVYRDDIFRDIGDILRRQFGVTVDPVVIPGSPKIIRFELSLGGERGISGERGDGDLSDDAMTVMTVDALRKAIRNEVERLMGPSEEGGNGVPAHWAVLKQLLDDLPDDGAREMGLGDIEAILDRQENGPRALVRLFLRNIFHFVAKDVILAALEAQAVQAEADARGFEAPEWEDVSEGDGRTNEKWAETKHSEAALIRKLVRAIERDESARTAFTQAELREMLQGLEEVTAASKLALEIIIQTFFSKRVEDGSVSDDAMTSVAVQTRAIADALTAEIVRLQEQEEASKRSEGEYLAQANQQIQQSASDLEEAASAARARAESFRQEREAFEAFLKNVASFRKGSLNVDDLERMIDALSMARAFQARLSAFVHFVFGAIVRSSLIGLRLDLWVQRFNQRPLFLDPLTAGAPKIALNVRMIHHVDWQGRVVQHAPEDQREQAASATAWTQDELGEKTGLVWRTVYLQKDVPFTMDDLVALVDHGDGRQDEVRDLLKQNDLLWSDAAMAVSLEEKMARRPGYVGTVYQIPSGGTDRVGQEGKVTFRAFEVFDLPLSDQEEQVVLDQIARDPHKHIVLLKADTIRLAANGPVKVVLTPDMGIIPKDFIGQEVQIGDNAPSVLEGAVSADPTSIPEGAQVRLSFAGLYRIKVNVEGEDYYLLSFNKNRLKKGKLTITPIGGAYDFQDEAGKRIYEDAGIDMEADDEEKPLEIRQKIAQAHLGRFLELFREGQGREWSAVRELEEELVGEGSEEDVFAELPQAARGMAQTFMRNLTAAEIFDELKKDLQRLSPEFPMADLEEAYTLAIEHYTEIRDDGRVYAVHPLEIALHLVRALGIMDRDVILAAILHDLVEDTDFTLEKVKALFGDGVADIVSDLTEDTSYRKNDKVPYEALDKQVFHGRLATKVEHLDRVSKSKNPRTKNLKTADRLNNLLTNESPANGKQRRMEIPELDRWDTFLEDPDLDARIVAEIRPFLDRERAIIESDAAMAAGFPSADDIVAVLRALMRSNGVRDSGRYTLTISENEGKVVVSIDAMDFNTVWGGQSKRERFVDELGRSFRVTRNVDVRLVDTQGSPWTIKFQIFPREGGKMDPFDKAIAWAVLTEYEGGLVMGSGELLEALSERRSAALSDVDWFESLPEAFSYVPLSDKFKEKRQLDAELIQVLSDAIELDSRAELTQDDLVGLIEGLEQVEEASKLVLKGIVEDMFLESLPDIEEGDAAMGTGLPAVGAMTRTVELFLSHVIAVEEGKYELSVLKSTGKMVVSIEMADSAPWGRLGVSRDDIHRDLGAVLKELYKVTVDPVVIQDSPNTIKFQIFPFGENSDEAKLRRAIFGDPEKRGDKAMSADKGAVQEEEAYLAGTDSDRDNRYSLSTMLGIAEPSPASGEEVKYPELASVNFTLAIDANDQGNRQVYGLDHVKKGHEAVAVTLELQWDPDKGQFLQLTVPSHRMITTGAFVPKTVYAASSFERIGGWRPALELLARQGVREESDAAMEGNPVSRDSILAALSERIRDLNYGAEQWAQGVVLDSGDAMSLSDLERWQARALSVLVARLQADLSPTWTLDGLTAQVDRLEAAEEDTAFLKQELQVVFKETVVGDKAMAKDLGGIDFNAGNLDMNVSKEGVGVQFNIDPAQMEKFKSGDFTGLKPVILNIVPIQSVLPLLGLNETTDGLEIAGQHPAFMELSVAMLEPRERRKI